MNLNTLLPLLTLAINLLLSPLAFGMEHKLTCIMKQRYIYLREIVMKLDLLVRTEQQTDIKEKRNSLLQPLEPEEIELIEQAFLLTHDYSRPVGRLLKFLDAEDRLKEKMKQRFNLQEEPLQEHAVKKKFISQSDEIEEIIMPWEIIIPHTTLMQPPS
jgi:hypothetical protein